MLAQKQSIPYWVNISSITVAVRPDINSKLGTEMEHDPTTAPVFAQDTQEIRNENPPD